MIESSFSALKDMGLAGTSQNRPAWAGDDQMRHLAWMAVVTLTARRLAHADGTYEQTFEEAQQLGLLNAPSPTRQSAAVMTADELAAYEQELFRIAKAPAGWPEVSIESDDYHLLIPT